MEQRNFLYTSRSYLSVNSFTPLPATDAKRIMILRESNIIDIMTFYIANASRIFNLCLQYVCKPHITYPVSHEREIRCARYIIQRQNITNNTNAWHGRAVSELILWYIVEFNILSIPYYCFNDHTISEILEFRVCLYEKLRRIKICKSGKFK